MGAKDSQLAELSAPKTGLRRTQKRRSISWVPFATRILGSQKGPFGELWFPFREVPPAPRTRSARIALVSVGALVAVFTGFYAAYLFALHDAYLTHSEDMGIMMQALWNTTHGAPLHQTVCNIVSDTNCLGDVSRLAIHFEPIMFPLALIYGVFPSAKTLQLLQAVIVAVGAFPAYWIASRRLGNQFIGVIFALLYLLHASLDSAVTFDFHPVTLAAPALMFALYFLLTRNDLGLYISCLLAMSTKEEVALSVVLIGLCALVFQRRWRVGAGLLVMALLWIALGVLVMHAVSPAGISPTIGRYAQFGDSPAQIVAYVLTHPALVLRNYVFDQTRFLYLRALVAPLGFLAILSPLVLLITAPALAINLLSNNPSMYSGFLQYTAESVPVMVFAAIQGVALLSRLGGPLIARLVKFGEGFWRSALRPRPALALFSARLRLSRLQPAAVLAVVLSLAAVGFSVHDQRDHDYTPLGATFAWPQTSAHTRMADHLVALIPATASVSAQSNLVPHLSNRRYIYLFPYQDQDADYVLLDETDELYPLQDAPAQYAQDVAQVFANPAYHVVVARDGFILLSRAGA
jgi:uncharacterized membrane protein